LKNEIRLVPFGPRRLVVGSQMGGYRTGKVFKTSDMMASPISNQEQGAVANR
jgi:hypothetical protein